MYFNNVPHTLNLRLSELNIFSRYDYRFWKIRVKILGVDGSAQFARPLAANCPKEEGRGLKGKGGRQNWSKWTVGPNNGIPFAACESQAYSIYFATTDCTLTQNHIIEGYQMRLFGGKLREHEGTHLIKKTHFPNKGPGSLKSSIKVVRSCHCEGPCLYRIAIL